MHHATLAVDAFLEPKSFGTPEFGVVASFRQLYKIYKGLENTIADGTKASLQKNALKKPLL